MSELTAPGNGAVRLTGYGRDNARGEAGNPDGYTRAVTLPLIAHDTNRAAPPPRSLQIAAATVDFTGGVGTSGSLLRQMRIKYVLRSI